MHFAGAVEVTKFLRDRSKELKARVSIACQLLNGQLNVILPRKETVILQWILDMLASDLSAKHSIELWELLFVVWPVTSTDGRMRVFKNHKLAVNVSDAVSTNSAELIDVVTNCILLISETAQILSYASDSQACQLVLAYLSSSAAIANRRLGDFVFESVKSRVKIFGKSDPSVFALISHEPVEERKLHYLVDYLSVSGNSVETSMPTTDGFLQLCVRALCDADVMVVERFMTLCTSNPDRIQVLVSTLSARKPSYLNSQLLEHIAQILFSQPSLDWNSIEECLRINPAPILDNQEYLSRIMKSDSLPEAALSLIIKNMATLRRLTEFLLTWSPPEHISESVHVAILKAIDTLSPVQIANLLREVAANYRLLELIVQSLSYQVASSSSVMSALEFLLTKKEVPARIKNAILEVLPRASSWETGKTSDAKLILRLVELDAKPMDVVRPAIKSLKSEFDEILLRYFPLLEQAISSKSSRLSELVQKTKVSTRYKLATSARAWECERLTAILIDTAIRNREMQILDAIPKQAYTWDQRHMAVDSAISDSSSFYSTAAVILKLIDTQKLPSAISFGKFLNTAGPTEHDIQAAMDLVQAVAKSREYVAEVMHNVSNEWLQCLISCQLSRQSAEALRGSDSTILSWLRANYEKLELIEPTVAILSLFPGASPEVQAMARKLTINFIANGMTLHRKLFQTLCHQEHHWTVMTALYLSARCENADIDFAQYCKGLKEQELDLLLLTAADESQYEVLSTLAYHKLIITDSDSLSAHRRQQAVTVAIVKATVGASEFYWNFCDTLIREYPALLTQFAVETILEVISKGDIDAENWDKKAVVLSRLLLLKRGALRFRIHLIISAFTCLLSGVHTPQRAHTFTRLVDNLCNPPNVNHRSRTGKHELSSQIARERRHVAKHAGVLLQNLLTVILHNTSNHPEWTSVSAELRQAAFHLVDLIYGDGLKAVTAGMDHATRAYLRSIFEDYKLHGRWSSD